jgi:putative flippase GtrA
MQFIRYLLVQVIAYGIDMGGFIFLSINFEFNPLFANSISKIFAGLFAFFSHSKFTFEVSNEASYKKQFFRYFSLLALNLPISAFILSIVLLVVPNAVAAKFIADLIVILFTYWLSKSYVFLKK